MRVLILYVNLLINECPFLSLKIYAVTINLYYFLQLEI